MYFALTAFIQLDILLTRNPGFWFHFGPRTAPRPSLALIAPVAVFLLGSTFIAVYWPLSVQPDGGAAALQGAGGPAVAFRDTSLKLWRGRRELPPRRCAGWVPVLLVWAYVLIWVQVADAAKVLVQRLFAAHGRIKVRPACLTLCWAPAAGELLAAAQPQRPPCCTISSAKCGS